jgi:hypothetical protein
MYDNTVHRDYVKSELEYRLNRIHDEIAGRRRRRAFSRRGNAGDSTWPTAR